MITSIIRNQIKSKCCVLTSFSARHASQSIQTAEYIDKDWDNALPFEKIPGPSKWTFLKEFSPGGRYYNLDMTQMNKKFNEDYGDILYIPEMFRRHAFVFVYDPNDFEKVYRTEGVWPIRIGLETFKYYRDEVRPDLFEGTGGLGSEQGEKWASLRTKVNPVMMQPKTVKLYIPTIDEIAKEFTEKIREERDAKNEVTSNFNDVIGKWALESIAYVALDTRLNIMNDINPNSRSQIIVKCVRDFFEQSYELEMKPSLWKYFTTPMLSKQIKTLDLLTEQIQSYIGEAIEKLEANSKTTDKSENEMSVLEKLLKIDRSTAMVMATDMLMAGVDTTGSVTINLLYLLAKNPEKQQLLREEIMKIMPEKDSPLTFDSLNNIPFLRGCLKETNRLHPIISESLRAAGSNLVLKGYQIPKGTNVLMLSVFLQKSDDMFPNGKEFIPERWLREGNSTGCPSAKTAHPFAFLPFGFGPRMCVGRRFAELEVFSLIARLVRNYNIEWHYPDLQHRSMLIKVPVGDMKFRFNDLSY